MVDYAEIENSEYLGRPVELLKISTIEQTWRYTSSEIPLTYNGEIYTPTTISHGDISPLTDTSKSGVPIKLARNAPVGDLFKASAPSEVVTVTLYGSHYDENTADMPGYVVLWKGRLINVEWDDTYMTLTTEGVFSSLQRVGIRRRCSALCPYTLYGSECTVNKQSRAHSFVVSSISGLSVVVTPMNRSTNYFTGGMIEYINQSGNIERRMIKSSVTVGSIGTLSLATTPFGLTVGENVTLYPGCDHSLATCNNKFSNGLNFGGQPFVPTLNPFNGSSIY